MIMEYICIDNLVRRTKLDFNPIVAKVHYPKLNTDFEWLCLIEVQGLQNSGSFRAYGVDSFQAMQLGIRTLIDLIRYSTEQLRGDILIQDSEGVVEKLDPNNFFSLCVYDETKQQTGRHPIAD